ncbi:eye-specific diacylglycerol kinase isoform X3 [Anthonomus grandis grandis]|uniref:eye-specific diacylglycerol kinase isoform X3 n=1 Tax=Anthonomus grandis grandis TaxID=2921223 RepID=UPI002165C3A2|nr:eye-specific diacylglycerol kinase isoform X3 [Anthonomus grandis grandis]
MRMFCFSCVNRFKLFGRSKTYCMNDTKTTQNPNVISADKHAPTVLLTAHNPHRDYRRCVYSKHHGGYIRGSFKLKNGSLISDHLDRVRPVAGPLLNNHQFNLKKKSHIMHRLRTTFKRSRTPTGAEMKMQSSLEVPKQIRSASFDEIQLEAKRLQAGGSVDSPALLGVPQLDKRSRSMDAGGSEESGNFLEVPSKRFHRRRSSGGKGLCIHCVCQEEYFRLHPPELLPLDIPEWLPFLTDSSSEGEEEEDDEEETDDDEITTSQCTTEYSRNTTHCSRDTSYSRGSSYTDTSRENSFDPPEFVLTVTLLPNIPSPTISSPPPIPASPIIEFFPPESDSEVPLTPTQTRRKSIHRQEAFFAEPTGTSLENMSDAPSEPASEGTSEGALSEGDAPHTNIPGLVVSDIYLQVPDLRRDRAASVDSCFSKVPEKKTEELQHSGVSLEVPVGPNVALRSRSVDIVLPTDEQARYKALAMTAPPATVHKGSATSGGDKPKKGTPEWGEQAAIGDHLWVSTSMSGELCFVGESECLKHGNRYKCSACNILCHEDCIHILTDRQKFMCKPSFRDVGVRQYREQTTIQHHWVHRRSEKGKCQHCAKSFQSKLSFGSKDIVAISCSWCKVAFHNKESCFNIQRIGEECNLGVHNNIIVPPSWIVKLPKKGSFKSSLRKVPKKKGSNNKKRVSNKDKEYRTFVIKPIPSTNVTPVIVFINPKSGGNQGLKLMQKFQWLLNPRQVFDLTQGGPKFGLDLFRKVPNLRVLACGGDGTVGWVLSVIDQIKMKPAPPVGVLPLGTGNDLARALGWGGGYTDEPISKILTNISHSDTVLLDRWCLDVRPNQETGEQPNDGKDSLPLNVVNNYYSLGVDAHIALEFHEAREAHPERFNSRLRNKMFYGQMGGKDLLKRKWKGLADFVTLECDGNDITPKLKELRVHAIVFLNIGSYGGGTKPWTKTSGTTDPSTEDGLIEVLGLTTYQLPLLQAGGHGTSITQCRSAKIVTTKTIPMQVDGEACKLKPSIISISHLNKATMLAKRKSGKVIPPQAALQTLKYNVFKLSMPDYEQHHYDKDKLAEVALQIGSLEMIITADLEQARTLINQILEDRKENQGGNLEWCFVDSCTAERFFRIDKAQENLHYVMDIACENLYILECGGGTVPQTPEDETAHPSPTSNHKTSLVIPEMRISDEGSLDSPSDQPPVQEVQIIDSPEEGGGDTIRSPTTTGNIIRSFAERLFSLNQQTCSAFRIVEERPNEELIEAAKNGDFTTIKELHLQGYSLRTRDSTGQIPIHYAARYGHKDIIKYIINNAPNTINDKDINLGQTALHKAASYRWRDICCMLVAGGAKLDVTDHRGNTARTLALQSEDRDLAAYLLSQEQFQVASSEDGTEV